MLIDCDTCTARGAGCGDCVVTVLLGAPPSWSATDPVVVALPARPLPGAGADRGNRSATATGSGPSAEDAVVPAPGNVVEFDEVERRAVRALAECGLVPPLRHRTADERAADDAGGRPAAGERATG
ncbi:hypothetical protein OF117_18455 [Geodermatophilus sp. YIM 151500]|uniref:hypothetical protein n=1 Tax=Geodermatophilus sp. YIM 151500 TaxID=2984531 RepID=UPI0021E4A2B0|nr:hypothetical protein [Geodermatophilus sp. YIM 151500]MCV2491333.1 hypothetical protein [Geodermatophilus sp. YIM 151500]